MTGTEATGTENCIVFTIARKIKPNLPPYIMNFRFYKFKTSNCSGVNTSSQPIPVIFYIGGGASNLP